PPSGGSLAARGGSTGHGPDRARAASLATPRIRFPSRRAALPGDGGPPRADADAVPALDRRPLARGARRAPGSPHHNPVAAAPGERRPDAARGADLPRARG